MTALLALALFVAPAALLALDRRRLQVGALGVAGLWLLLALVDIHAGLGRFGGGAAHVAIGTWLLVASITWPQTRWVTAPTVVAAGVAVGGVALAAGGGDRTDAVGALAIAAAVLLVGARREDDGGSGPAVGMVLGVALLAVGAAGAGSDLGLLGATVGATAAAWRARRAGVVLLPTVLVVGALSPTFEWWHAAVLAVAGAALAGRPVVSLSLWTLAVGTVGVDVGLLGAAPVLVAATMHPAVAVTALPGAAMAVGALVDRHSRWVLVIALLAALTAMRLWRPPVDVVPARLSPSTGAALGLGAWLLLAPETWLGATALESWGTGVVVSAVAGGVGAFVVASFTDATFAVPDLEVADPLFPPRDPPWTGPAAIAALVVLVLAGGALIASVVS